ncbi:bORF4 [Murid betaherpesvirus 8]|uniref:BORF4 n=2 Tax=Rat cytomegalovirus (isolate England) TaxID=1261657 RepID=K7YNL7_RCMVE|nr:eORF4 [Murid betaherpesvirus 8]AKE44235.1 ORF4 [Rat cytomegalovirus ALL-03]AFX83382.1 eORF4 [Murid betaherpesvirus 8]AKB93262.1 bORF4 [Murid betaherpesvirus 8]WPH24977.1 bORF4 [Murid betaherpesvirus 8]WPH25111.1 bORF4 [Murid betaherpesvirus 8]
MTGENIPTFYYSTNDPYIWRALSNPPKNVTIHTKHPPPRVIKHKTQIIDATPYSTILTNEPNHNIVRSPDKTTKTSHSNRNPNHASSNLHTKQHTRPFYRSAVLMTSTRKITSHAATCNIPFPRLSANHNPHTKQIPFSIERNIENEYATQILLTIL